MHCHFPGRILLVDFLILRGDLKEKEGSIELLEKEMF